MSCFLWVVAVWVGASVIVAVGSVAWVWFTDLTAARRAGVVKLDDWRDR